MNEIQKDKHGVQSIEVGVGLLRVMVEDGHPMMLRDIAAAVQMPAPKAHRYLVSLIRAGLVEQEPASSRYSLGPFALSLGLAALGRIDRVKLGLEAIAELRDATNETTALVVWGSQGPVVVRWERPRRAITVNVLTGSTLGLLDSASGLVFAAWMPRDLTEPLIARGLAQQQQTRAEVEAMLARVRQQGWARLVGGQERNVVGIAAPVFNFQHAVTMALLIVGVEGLSDLGPDSPALAELVASAQRLSSRLGAPDQPR